MQPITLTPAAIGHIQQIIQKQGHGIGFRLSVIKDGCSGWRYSPDIIDEAKLDDIQFTADHLVIFIDPDSAEKMQGTTVDVLKKSLDQWQLVFDNPRAENPCGCGESFSLKDAPNDD